MMMQLLLTCEILYVGRLQICVNILPEICDGWGHYCSKYEDNCCLMPCILVDIYQCFEGTSLHPQGRSVSCVEKWSVI
jgi:hypothetical protein